MELSKFKLEVYDLLGTLVPGLLTLALVAYILLPHTTGKDGLPSPSAGWLTLLLLSAFASGQVVQEASDVLVRWIRGPRFLKSCRDTFWKTPAAEPVRKRILAESGVADMNVDVAFEYCLSSLGTRFLKRDTFIAVADLARSLWCLAVAALVLALGHSAYVPGWAHRAVFLSKTVPLTVAIGSLCWRRMVRFRYLSEAPVFSTFLALPPASAAAPAAESHNDDGGE